MNPIARAFVESPADPTPADHAAAELKVTRLATVYEQMPAEDAARIMAELPDPLVHAGGRQADFLANLGERGPGVPLEGDQDRLIPFVEHADMISEIRRVGPNKPRLFGADCRRDAGRATL